MSWTPTPGDTPYDRMGEELVRRLVTRFYDHLDANEPALAQLHECDAQGKVSLRTREDFALFLLQWLGGPGTYSARKGHPRLRMRHASVPVNLAMRDAWLRSMQRAMDDVGLSGEVRAFLDARFAEVADFLRNAPG